MYIGLIDTSACAWLCIDVYGLPLRTERKLLFYLFTVSAHHYSHIIRKPDFCICEQTKVQISLSLLRLWYKKILLKFYVLAEHAGGFDCYLVRSPGQVFLFIWQCLLISIVTYVSRAAGKPVF